MYFNCARCATTFPYGRELKFLRYGTGHLLEMQLSLSYQHDRLHPETHRTMGALELETHYDMAGRITQRRCTDNLRDRLVSERRYQWDRADQIIRRIYTDGAPSTPAEKYRQPLWGYDAAGRMTQNLRFQGQYLDRKTGLHYNTFRYYDPVGGCYTQLDPIGLLGRLNTYTYVVDPLGWVDPLGLAVDSLVKLEERGYNGVVKTPGGGVDYSNSNAFYNKKPGVNPIVKIEYSGDYEIDFERANYEADLNQKTTPSGYVWHHLDDYDVERNKGTMQLVEKPSHRGINHNGGVSQYIAATGKQYIHPGGFRSKRICSVL